MFRRCDVGKMREEGPTNILPPIIVGQVNVATAVNIISMIINTAIGAPVETVQRSNGIIAMVDQMLRIVKVMGITAVANINAHIHQAESSQNARRVDT